MSSPHLHDIDRLLSVQGYTLIRQRSSHRHYRNAHGQVVTVSVHSTVFNWRQVASIRADIARQARERGAAEAEREASA